MKDILLVCKRCGAEFKIPQAGRLFQVCEDCALKETQDYLGIKDLPNTEVIPALWQETLARLRPCPLLKITDRETSTLIETQDSIAWEAIEYILIRLGIPHELYRQNEEGYYGIMVPHWVIEAWEKERLAEVTEYEPERPGREEQFEREMAARQRISS